MDNKIVVFIDFLSVMPSAIEAKEKNVKSLFDELQRLRMLYDSDEVIISLITDETIIGNRKINYDFEQLYYESLALLKSLCNEYKGIRLGHSFTKEFDICMEDGNKKIKIVPFRQSYTQSKYVLDICKEDEVKMVVVCDKNGRKYLHSLKDIVTTGIKLNTQQDSDIPVILCENSSFHIKNRKSGVEKFDSGDSFIISTAARGYYGTKQCLSILNELKYLSLMRAKSTISSALKTSDLDIELPMDFYKAIPYLEELVIAPSSIDFALDCEEPNKVQRRKIKKKPFTSDTECPF